MIWIEVLIFCFVLYEAVVISIYRLLQKTNPEMTLWVVMGSKLLKLLGSVVAILLVPRLTTIPIKTFALTVVGVYFVSIIVETIIFLQKKQNNEQQQ